MNNQVSYSSAYFPESISREDFTSQPEDYRDFLIHILSAQAYAERLGATELAYCIKLAPGYQERKIIGRILADEANHSYLLFRELEAIGVTERQAIELVEERSGGRFASMAGPAAVAAADNEWLDVVLNHMFLDRAGKFMVENFSFSSYKPWAVACKQILEDEFLHEGFGYRELRRYLNDFSINKEYLSQRATKWYAFGLNFFGPPGSKSMVERLRYYGLKRKSNEELRQAYRAEVEEILTKLNVADLIHLNRHDYPYM